MSWRKEQKTQLTMESNNETTQRTTAGESNCLLFWKKNVNAAAAQRCSPTQGEASPHRPPSQRVTAAVTIK